MKDTKKFYEWCLKKDYENMSYYTYDEFLDMCDDMVSWCEYLKPMYDECLKGNEED